jgi:hypothetical protein
MVTKKTKRNVGTSKELEITTTELVRAIRDNLEVFSLDELDEMEFMLYTELQERGMDVEMLEEDPIANMVALREKTRKMN